MLGNACVKVFANNSEFDLVKTARNEANGAIKFDAKSDSLSELLSLAKPDWIINCIGIIKPHIKENDYESNLNAIAVNSTFPHLLAQSISGTSTRVIQIATDCVYSGKTGAYLESAPHDPTDVYGKTKSLGEVVSEQFTHIRASIIGPEVGRVTSLQEWFLNQPQGASVNGFTDHLWNGVTTHHFGLIAKGMIEGDVTESGTHHILPGDIVTKAELLRIFARVYGREDISINPIVSPQKIDRTLNTENLEFSNHIWKIAGYDKAPTISEMVEEQKEFNLNS
jgi:dTDP-4-dehydrorhamnose reductase